METIPGGAFLAPDGKTWLNSKNEPLSKEQIAAAEKLNAERAEQLQAAEEERVTRQVQNDPLAQTLARALRPQEEKREVSEPRASVVPDAPPPADDTMRRTQRGRG